MVNFIKKYWYLIFVAIAVFVLFGFYQNCQEKKFKKAITEMKQEVTTITDLLNKEQAEKKAIAEAYEREKGKPPVVVEKEKIKIIKVKDTEYVSKKDYDDAILLAEFWKNEFEKADRKFKEYIVADTISDQLLMDSIYRLSIKIKGLESAYIAPQRAIGIAPYIGYELYPEQHISAGICIYYRVNFKKLLRAIF